MITLDLFISNPVHAGQATNAPVIISGAPAKALITVTLEQTRGKAPLFGPKKQTVRADGSGGAVAMFELKLKGPTPSAVLITSATDDQGSTYPVDGDTVEVLP